jgi:CheY-like chemotaxis protein
VRVLKVLVIDDNTAHAEGLAELLSISGFDAVSVGSGVEGIEMAASLSADAILLDLHLPDMDGYEVCGRIRSNPATANTAIIFHTGSENPSREDSQADGFLTYPVSISEITAVVQGCVARRSRRSSTTTREIVESA